MPSSGFDFRVSSANHHVVMRPPGSYVSGPLLLHEAALFTDLYEITMASSYRAEGIEGPATFSLFVRRLPPERGFLIAAGLEDVLRFLEDFQFSGPALDYLRSLQRFTPAFLEYLADVRFTGEVRAVREGTPVFANEPLIEVTAPLPEAQLVEAAVLHLCHFQTLLASKAVRCVLAARGRPVVDFGLRRSHGVDAGLKAARCAYIAGVAMTSNVLAGQAFGIPVTGTMAHSYVTAFPHELDAFRAFARAFPRHTTLLIDTYDTISGARQAVQVARELAQRGERLGGVRLDSGDLVLLSKQVRAILDEAGLQDVKIFASGGLDEADLERFVESDAPIDAFGVGTRMDVSADAPYLDMAYKLVRYDGRDVLKTSPGKETWTGEKQIYRRRAANGPALEDVLALRDEPVPPGSQPLLDTVMREGRPTHQPPPLESVRAHCAAAVGALPPGVLRLGHPDVYAVRPSTALAARQRAAVAAVDRETRVHNRTE